MQFHRSAKDKKFQTTTFKHIAFPQNDKFENQEDMQFDSIINKQKTIDKVNSLQFENDPDRCRSLIDCLLKEYNLMHPQTESTICDEKSETNKQSILSNNDQNKENSMDFVKQQNNQTHINEETEKSNIKMKSNIIFLELQNKKLQLKEKLLEKKYQKELLQIKMGPNLQIQLRKKQKSLLQIQLNLLKQLKSLSESLQQLKYSYKNTLSLSSNIDQLDFKNKQEKKSLKKSQKRISHIKILRYLIQRTEIINSKQQFLSLIQKTSKSLYG